MAESWQTGFENCEIAAINISVYCLPSQFIISTQQTYNERGYQPISEGPK